MKERMVPEQEVSDAGEDLVRLAAAKDAEITRLRNTIGWEASVAYRAEIAALKAEVEIAEQNADRWADRYNEIWPKLDQVTEQRDRAMKALIAVSEMLYQRPDMVAALRPLMGPAETEGT